MSLDNLPVEWSIQKFEKVVYKIVGGGTPSKNNPEYYQGNIPWMSVKDMNKNILEDTVDHITQEAIDNSATNLIPKGTPIIATRMSLGKVVVANFDSAINQDLKAIFLGEYIDNNFFVYWYRSQAKLIESLGTGTTVKGIRLEVVNNLDFPVVPLAEQQEIVRQLDIMLAQVEQIKARLEAIPAILKKFRQSVLADAVSGDLLPQDVYEDYQSEELKNLTLKIGSGSTPKGGNSAYQTIGIPFVRSLNIHTNYIKYKDLAFINEEQAEKLKNVEIFKDDILLNITGASIGRVNIAPKEFIGGRVNQHVSIIRCDQTKLLPYYLHILLASPSLQKWIEGENYGATRQALTKGMLENLIVNYPSIDLQNHIVQKVRNLFAYANKIEETVQLAQKRVNLLTQSILAKAFSGELTAEWREQHQDLITGVNSAEALLAKIQVEREASKPVKKTRAKKEA